MATPNLRSRRPAAPRSEEGEGEEEEIKTSPSTSNPQHEAPPRIRFSVFDILRLLAGLFVLSSTLSYLVTSNSIFWNYRPAHLKAWLLGPLHLTPTQLSLYNGTDPSLPIYLALNSTIYDVSASPQLYGPGGSYHFFAGRDATRAFVTGCFDTDLVPDLRGVEEMFIPLDDDDDDLKGEKKSREERRERKVRREREAREARRKVWEAVEGWRVVFDGGKGGKYFRVGTVVAVQLGEKRDLCEKARKMRPRRGD